MSYNGESFCVSQCPVDSSLNPDRVVRRIIKSLMDRNHLRVTVTT